MLFRPSDEGRAQAMWSDLLGFDYAESKKVLSGGFEMVLDGAVIEMFAKPIIEAGSWGRV
jgi:hypothetical protein